MKAASPGLIAHLNSGRQFRRAELWTFTFGSGAIAARYTTLDADVTVGGNTWVRNGPVLTRPGASQKVGVDVDQFEISVEPKDTDTIGGLTWIVAARRGLLRNGRVLIERVYMPTWLDTSLGKLYHMGGRMAQIAGDSGKLDITVRSDLELLNVKEPVDIVQPQCRWTLFDLDPNQPAGCTLSAAAFKVTGSVSGGSTVSSILATLGQATDYFTAGRIVFTSGPNNGESRQVKRHVSGSPATLTLTQPLFQAPAGGNTFDLYPGCDRTQATCISKFNNKVNFGGQPYVPPPETAL